MRPPDGPLARLHFPPGGKCSADYLLVGLKVHMFRYAKAVYYSDDLAVCQQSAPFKSLPAPTPLRE
jgi:hypothetical protein